MTSEAPHYADDHKVFVFWGLGFFGGWLSSSSMTRLSESPVYLIFSIGSRDCPYSRGLLTLLSRHCVFRSVWPLPFRFPLGLLPSFPECHRPYAPRPLCPLAFSSPAKIPGSLSQVGKWFSLTQSGNFSEPPLPLAHFFVFGQDPES